MERIALGEAAVGGEAPIPELSAGEDQTQSTGRHSILVLDLSLEIPDRVGWIDLEGNCPTRESSDENLQSSWDQRRRLDGGSDRRSRPAARMSLALGLLPFSSSVRAAQVASRSERYWLAGSRRQPADALWSVHSRDGDHRVSAPVASVSGLPGAPVASVSGLPGTATLFVPPLGAVL